MNSELYGKIYHIPPQILSQIRSKMYASSDSEGIKRAKNLVKNGYCTYQTLKRLKNFFDTYNSSTRDQYDLAGGDMMRAFVENQLTADRKHVNISQNAKKDLKYPKHKSEMVAQTGNVNLKENEEKNQPNKNALVVILDNNNKILLLKRSSYEEQWMPNKLALVGGKVEDDEEPDQAALREVKEEIGIELDKLLEKFVIQREENNIEHMFVSKLPEMYDNDSITLSKEHSDYMWVSYDEIKNMPTDTLVPNLLDYIRIAVKNYS